MKWDDEGQVGALFRWLTRGGMAPRAGGRPIGWLQAHLVHAVELLEKALVDKGLDPETDLVVRGGNVMAGKEVIAVASDIYRKADSLARGWKAGARKRGESQRVHLTMRDDPTLAQVVKTAFPDYRGQRVELIRQDGPVDVSSHWTEGSRTYHVFVRLTDMHVQMVPDNYGEKMPIPAGFVLVQHIYFQGHELPIRIRVPGENFNAFLLPAPEALTWAEKVVLVATRSLKSSYMNISNYRFHEARGQTGITADEWEKSKASLIARGLLNRAGAITPKGRNALEAQGDRLDLYMLKNRTARLETAWAALAGSAS